MRFTKGWLRDITPENLLGYSFIIKGKGRGRRTLSSSRRRSASIISSSRLSSGIFLSLHGQARSTNYCVCVCVLCVQRLLITELTGQDVVMPPSFYFWEVLLLSKLAWFCG